MIIESDDNTPTPTNGAENSAILAAPTAEFAADENQADGTAATEIGTPGITAGTAATTAAVSQSLLPAALIGSILDFMPYKDLRTSLLVGKFMAVGVAKEVKTLNIMRSSELVIPAARRFTNVTEVICLCLMKPPPPEEALSVDTALRIVPFLSAFPELKSAFLGGYLWHVPHEDSMPEFVRYEYDMDHCTDLQVIFRGLVEQFCTSFQSGDLPGDLDLRGILPIGEGADDEGWTFASGKLIHACRSRHELGSQCELCRKICAFFPFQSVVRVFETENIIERLCVPTVERIRMLKGRPDSSAMFQSDAALDGLLRALYQRRAHVVVQNIEVPEDQEFIRRVLSNGCTFFETYINFYEFEEQSDYRYVGVNFLCEEKKREIRELVSAGFDVTLRAARRAQLMDMNRFSRPYHHQQHAPAPFPKEIWDRSSFDFLLSIGFDLDPTDFIVLDPKDEPAVLRNMKEKRVFLPALFWGGIRRWQGGKVLKMVGD